MSTVQDAPSTPSTPPADVEIRPYQFSAEVFRRMLDAEVFPKEDRVELRDGQVVEKMAKTQAHAVAGNLVHLALAHILPPGWFPGSENPVSVNQKRVPLPDLVVLRGGPKDYIARRPGPTDVGLIVEFALSSLGEDTTSKLADYAHAGIAAYWVFDLWKNQILVFERPNIAEGRYEVSQTITIGQAVPLRLDGVLVAEIPAVDLLPVSR